jgi:hypothetical protein
MLPASTLADQPRERLFQSGEAFWRVRRKLNP